MRIAYICCDPGIPGLGPQAAAGGLVATALYLQANQQITPQVQQFLDEALTQDPKEVSALSLLAAEAFKTRDYSTALWYGALATILYTFIGGFLAVSWTDTIQATLMIFALLLTPIFVLLSIGDTAQFSSVLAQAEAAANKDFTDFFTGLSLHLIRVVFLTVLLHFV